ncbi:MAG: adenine nucleotide alpha hydrolase [Gemmataceae bacterium]|nr:adenine nucleotide alpha hydrolase [Gemmataceae bacterium]MDW8242877.1 ATP-binding protein [Thermogemmata sp.]
MAVHHRVLISWSSGKDSAWLLHVLRQRADVDVVGLLTTVNEKFGRVAMHGVRREVLQAQAQATGLPLWEIPLPWPCSNADYEQRMNQWLTRAQQAGITAVAFGDLFLEDVRAYREKQLAATGIIPMFPLWGKASATAQLAHDMLAAGLQAVVVCVDPSQLQPPLAWIGRRYDTDFLRELPPHVDPCGERGEFHTLCVAGPMFRYPLDITLGSVVQRDGFYFVDVQLASPLNNPVFDRSATECDNLTR